jgi:hypothetical protein
MQENKDNQKFKHNGQENSFAIKFVFKDKKSENFKKLFL